MICSHLILISFSLHYLYLFYMFQNKYHIIPNIKSADPLHSISNIASGNFTSYFLSQRFPLYPINIIIATHGQPFNKVLISFHTNFRPTKVQVLGSQDPDQHSTSIVLGQMDFFGELRENKKIYTIRGLIIDKQISLNSKKQTILINPQYIKFRIQNAFSTNDINICQQIGIYALRIYNTKTNEQFKFLYNIEMDHKYPSKLLYILRQLQFLKFQAKKQQKYAYCGQLVEVIQQIQQIGSKKHSLNQKDKKYIQQIRIKYRLKQEPVKIESFIINNENAVHKLGIKSQIQVQQTIKKQKIVLKQLEQKLGIMQYKMLTSNNSNDTQQYLLNLWQKIKLKTGDNIDQFFQIYFYLLKKQNLTSEFLKIMSQIFQIATKKMKQNNIQFGTNQEYEQKLLKSLLDAFTRKHDANIKPHLMQPLFLLFNRMKISDYIDLLTNYKPLYIENQNDLLIVRLEVINKILRVKLEDEDSLLMILNYIKSIFKKKDLPKKQFNTGIQIISRLKKMMGKNKNILKNFEDLPIQLMLIIQKSLNQYQKKQKLQSNNQSNNLKQVNQQESQQQKPILDKKICRYCYQKDNIFDDQDLFDLHCFKSCLYLMNCPYCQAIIQIPEIFDHFIQQCQQIQSGTYKKCHNCGLIVKQQKYENNIHIRCSKIRAFECYFCNNTYANKKQLKDHLRNKKCEKNPRIK